MGVRNWYVWSHKTFAKGLFWPKHLTLGQKGCIKAKNGIFEFRLLSPLWSTVQWFQKYQPSNLNDLVLILKRPFFQLFNFDGWYFWNHWEFRDVMYLILKVQSMAIWILKLKGVTALLPSSTPFWTRPFYSIKGLSDPDLCPCVYLNLACANPVPRLQLACA